MAGFISKLFGGKSSSVLGVDIGTSSIKIVQLTRRGGRAVLETYGELALGPYAGMEIGRATNLPPEKISTALRDVMRESKVTAKEASIAIPFGASLIAAIEMPAITEKDLPKIMPIEARKYIPVPISEVMLDWIVVPKPLAGTPDFSEEKKPTAASLLNPAPPTTPMLDVLLVAIHNETLTRYQTIVNQASLNTSFFEIEIFSTIRSVISDADVSQMIIDMGAASTKIYIVERGIVRSSLVVNRGAQDITLAISKSLGISVQEAEIIKRDLAQSNVVRKNEIEEIVSLSLDYIFAEAYRTQFAYQKKYNKDVPRVFMVGGGARLNGILKLAEKHFQTEVILGDPFGKTQAPAFLEQILHDTGPEFAVAVGLALRKLQELQ